MIRLWNDITLFHRGLIGKSARLPRYRHSKKHVARSGLQQTQYMHNTMLGKRKTQVSPVDPGPWSKCRSVQRKTTKLKAGKLWTA